MHLYTKQIDSVFLLFYFSKVVVRANTFPEGLIFFSRRILVDPTNREEINTILEYIFILDLSIIIVRSG